MEKPLQFLDRAKEAGEDVEALKQGNEIAREHKVEHIDGLRNFIQQGQNTASPKEWTETFFQRDAQLKSVDNVDGLLTRVSAYIFGEGATLSEKDRELIAPLFPMTVKTLAVANKTLAPGTVWDLGTSGPAQSISLGTLTMGYGSSIVARNTAVSFTVDTIVKQGPTGANPPSGSNYDFGVLGVTGAVGATGSAGATGSVGSPGSKGTCKCSNTEPGSNGGPGGVGAAGGTGGTGLEGEDGRPSLPATITITAGITGANPIFTVKSQSGAGGRGGLGGVGGQGGPGGQGGYGTQCTGTCDDGGNGGNGGTGGRGGTGGNGGNGVAGQPILVKVPSALVNSIVKVQENAPPGDQGPGGNPGSGGGGGSAGGASMYCGGGTNGGPGATGGNGPHGEQGTNSGIYGTITVQPT